MIFILTLISCSKQSKIYYEYDGLVVTRFTDCSKDYILIGKHQNISDTLNSTFIKSSFSGFNSGMDAYMVFRSDRKIDIIGLGASFEKFGSNDSINLKDFENNIDFKKWEDNAKLNFKNIIRLSNVIKLEKKRNLGYKTEVQASYEN
ncbi:hypothetical protein ACQ9BO_11315 [Flavobacterium sp. P21]|uniref:hypothetical protein n=1 Tax=Flavobacterium sp. P21 TaxID=3423948 RepID=UPI003D66E076